MSTLQANTWTTSNLYGGDITAGAPIKITQVTIPYSAATGYAGGYQTFESATTGNTNQLYSFTYTPLRNSSYIHYLAFLEMDRSSNPGPEVLYVFINNVAYSNSYTYPRVSNYEPWQMRGQSGVYTNTDGSVLTFSLRCRNGSGWTNYIGGTATGGQIMTNTIQIFEVQR
jgi:hypothetical protein